jgi:aminoglycoside phosphotransferase (APT) family kinase protein
MHTHTSHTSRGIDLREGLARFLSEHLGGAFTVTGLTSSPTEPFRVNVPFDAKGDDRTLRLMATILPMGATQVNPITAEAAVRILVEHHGIPVPPVHSVCTDPTYVGGPFFLSGRVDGESIPRRVLHLVHEEGLGERIAGQLGEALGRLHGIDPAQAPEDLVDDHSENPAEAALIDADRRVAALPLPRPALALAVRWLERRLPSSPPRRAILHNDLRTGNIVVSRRGLASIVDWEGAVRRGDPMRDLAWAALRTWRFGEDALEVGGLASRAPFVAGYERTGGRFDEERFHWWKVMRTLRWALSLAAQTATHVDGRYRDIVLAASGRRVSELEWDILMLTRPFP